MGPNISFVPVQTSHGAGADAEARRFVRATAMKAFRQKQRLARSQATEDDTKQPKKTSRAPKKTSKREVKKATTPQQEECPELSPDDRDSIVTTPSSELSRCQVESIVDPMLFNDWRVPHLTIPEKSPGHPMDSWYMAAYSPNLSPSPIDLNMGGYSPMDLGPTKSSGYRSRDDLFNHFVNVIAPALQPLGSNSGQNPILNDWIQHALAEPAMLEATLFHTSVHLDGLNNTPWSPQTLQLRGETIRLVNELLQRPEDCQSDAAIAAISMLASSGNINGDQTDTNLHRAALKRIVELRGGLENLDASVEMLAMLGDILSSTITLSIPQFAHPSPLNNASLPPVDFESRIATIFKDLSELASAHSTLCTNPATSADILSFNKRRTAAEHALLKIDTNVPDDPTQSGIYSAVRIAGLICTNYIFRELSPALVVLNSLKLRLGETLATVDQTLGVQHMTTSNTQMLLWTCFIGGMVWRSNEYFAEGIARILPCLDLKTWTEIEVVLRKFLWVQKLRGHDCEMLWRDVLAQKELLQLKAQVLESEAFEDADWGTKQEEMEDGAMLKMEGSVDGTSPGAQIFG